MHIVVDIQEHQQRCRPHREASAYAIPHFHYLAIIVFAIKLPTAGTCTRIINSLDGARFIPPADRSRLEGKCRELAVEIVDMIHGYTCEFPSQPLQHQVEYDRGGRTLICFGEARTCGSFARSSAP